MDIPKQCAEGDGIEGAMNVLQGFMIQKCNIDDVDKEVYDFDKYVL